jgi:uncharacterized protein
MNSLKKNTAVLCSIFFFIFAIFIIITPSKIFAQNIVLSDDSRPTLSVIGEAEKQIPSDESKISLAVENTATDSTIASKNNAEKIGKIISALSTKGLTNKNISTTNFEIRPNYDNTNTNNYNKIISYTALNKIILTTSANVNISSFIDLAINNGANRIDGIEFITSKKVIDENFNNLLKEAFDNAKQRAETLSLQGGFLLNGVKKIDIPQNNGNLPPQPPVPSFAFNADSLQKSSSSPTQILPQENKLTISLPITFFIKNKIQ